jgi:Na+-driven multidrug efflux pump
MIRFINPEEKYVQKSAEILRLVSCSIFLYGMISVYFQTILGSGNTLVSMTIEFFAVLIYISCAYCFIKIFHWDVYWIWTVEYIYFTTLGGLSLLYLKLFDWKKKIV